MTDSRLSEPGRNDPRTRHRVLDAIRRGRTTIEALAADLGVTDNGVRFHVATLERDGLVRRAGAPKTGRLGKPAAIYELTEAGEEAQSRAYAPVLAALVAQLGRTMPRDEIAAMMHGIGRRIANGTNPAAGSLEDRAAAGARAVNSLGGAATVERGAEGVFVRGHGCPLAAAVAHEPLTCNVVQELLSEVVGEQRTRSLRPRLAPELQISVRDVGRCLSSAGRRLVRWPLAPRLRQGM